MSQEKSTAKFSVLICVDESDNAEQAFDYYVKYIHKPDNKITIVHVAEMVHPASYTYVGPAGAFAMAGVMDQMIADAKAKNTRIRAKYTSKCKESGLEPEYVTLNEEYGGVGSVIVAEAKKLGVMLIFMGSRGQGVIRRTILGSVSDYVLHHSHVPTMICPKSIN